jgi:HEAT repeat protein
MAPEESEAYEQDWYRMMKSLAERRERSAREGPVDDAGADAPALAGPISDETAGMVQLAALEAVQALGDIGGASAVTALIECLDDPDAPVRIRVIETLGDLGDRRAVPAIRTLAGADPDPGVVIVAKETLTRLDAP